MTPRRFLFLGGTVLVTAGVAGIASVLGSISEASFFHPPRWINWVHFVFGGFVLSVAISGRRRWQERLTLGATISGLTLGLSGLLGGRLAAKRFNLPELADPSDHLAHLLIGLLALWGWSRRRV